MTSLTLPLFQSRLSRSSLKRISAAIAIRKTLVALSLVVTGWSLMWAQALAIVKIAPQSFGLSRFSPASH
jgi:hypothetical protein